MKQKFFSFGTKWFIALMALLLINACSQEEDVSQGSSGIVDEASHNNWNPNDCFVPVYISVEERRDRFGHCSTKGRNQVCGFKNVITHYEPDPECFEKPRPLPCYDCHSFEEYPFDLGPETIINELLNGAISFKDIADLIGIEIGPGESILYPINENLALMQFKSEDMNEDGNNERTSITFPEGVGEYPPGTYPGVIDKERGIENFIIAKDLPN